MKIPAFITRHKRGWQHVLIWASTCVVLTLLISALAMYAYWHQHKDEPEVIGLSFSQVQMERYGVDWHPAYEAMLEDLNVKHLRLAAYWDRIEKTPGEYDFTETDWMIQQAKLRGAKIKLTIGQKLLRYPECYYPEWLDRNNPQLVEERIDKLLAAIVSRYKDEPTIEAWQLENEFLLRTFGICPSQNFTNAKLSRELAVVKNIDPQRPVILTQSNQIGFPGTGPVSDFYGFSMYRTVWNNVFGYFDYPQRGVYNWWKAALIEAYWPTTVSIHEMQGEAWGPRGNEELSWEEAQRSMNPTKFRDNIAYARETQIKRFDLWGVEWWYALKVKQGHPDMWDEAKRLWD